ncbi:MAG: hypothetical protein IK038_03085 [Bacteroidaceae bacterium]|nr:hypothetical protein [Bacteroidaceae bacterium]
MSTEQPVVVAIIKVRTYKEKGEKKEIRYNDDPIKFVGSPAEADAFINDLKKSYWWDNDITYECQSWTMARFAEYVRQQFETINERFDNHRL